MNRVAADTQERDNSFGFVRFLAASGVIFSHHFAISGFKEPYFAWHTFGSLSVHVFFFMSGYLIFCSIERNSDFARFLSARILRIVPNLLFVLSVTSVATLFVYSNFENLWDHVRYVAQNVLMLARGGPFHEVPGIWEARPYPSLNGSIWSLPYEVWCYFILFFTLRKARGRIRLAVAIALLGSIALYLLPDTRLWPSAVATTQLGALGFWFFAGSFLAAIDLRVPLLHSSRMSWFEKGGDPSYGMYIAAWPIQQSLIILIPGFWTSMVASFVVTTVVGYLTWHLLEKHALKRVAALAKLLRGERWLSAEAK
jgi:peptidoglycan/LPS O-acetylase OafA/YrhL